MFSRLPDCAFFSPCDASCVALLESVCSKAPSSLMPDMSRKGPSADRTTAAALNPVGSGSDCGLTMFTRLAGNGVDLRLSDCPGAGIRCSPQ